MKDGAINWKNLVKFNSSAGVPKKKKKEYITSYCT